MWRGRCGAVCGVVALVLMVAGCSGDSDVRIIPARSKFRIVVPNISGSTVTKYAVPAKGTSDIAPLFTLAGANTGLQTPRAVAINSKNEVIVSDPDALAIELFEVTASGLNDIAPAATISGANTGLTEPVGVALDAQDNIYVVDRGAKSIFEFAPPAPGANDVAPVATIAGTNTTFNAPFGITIDTASGDIFVTDDRVVPGVLEFAPPPAGINDVAPVATIAGNNTGLNTPLGVTLDGRGHIYVADEVAGFFEFNLPPPGTEDVAPIANVPLDLVLTGIAVDPQQNVYVAGYSDNSILKFAPLAAGTTNPAPVATLAGSNTNLDGPELFALVK